MSNGPILLSIDDLNEALADLVKKRGICRPGGYHPEYRAFSVMGVTTLEVVLRPVTKDTSDVKET